MTPDPRTVSEHARSAILDPDRIRVVVTLPTFRRPDHLVMTLDSLEAQAFGDETAVVVMDNDADGLQGANAAAEWLRGSRLKGMVIVAHQRGNCHAYNAGWETALAEFPRLTHIAVIDDDELAGPGWLGACSNRRSTGADLVGGPQAPVFADPALDRWRRHPVFGPHYRDRTGSDPLFVRQCADLAPVLDMPCHGRFSTPPSISSAAATATSTGVPRRGFLFRLVRGSRGDGNPAVAPGGILLAQRRSLRNGAISAISRNANPGHAGRLRTARQITGPACGLAACAACGWDGRPAPR
jgi:hypothetical protein